MFITFWVVVGFIILFSAIKKPVRKEQIKTFEEKNVREKFRYVYGHPEKPLGCRKCQNDVFFCKLQFGMIADMECCRCGTVTTMRDGGSGARKA